MSTPADRLNFDRLRTFRWNEPIHTASPYRAMDIAGSGYQEDEGTEFSDYAKLIMSGGAGLAQSAGWLLRTMGAESVGSSIEELGSNAVDYWHDSLTPAMKNEISKEVIRKNDQGEYEWGDPSWQTIAGMGAESLLGTAAGMGVGAGLTKVLQVFANPYGRRVLTETIEAGLKPGATSAAMKAGNQALKKRKLVDSVLGAGGFGAGEGFVGGISAGASVYDNIMRLPVEQLMQNPRYRQVYESTDTSISELERHQYAADTVAKEASSAAGWQSGLTTALLGAPMGAYFGRILGGARLSSTLPRAVATGAGGEAAQEFAQSGVEQLISNIQTMPFDPDLDMFEGVINAAVSGMLAGAALGGAFGPANIRGARFELAQEEREKALENLSEEDRVGGELLAQTVRTMEAASHSARNAGVTGKAITAIVGEAFAGRLDPNEATLQIKALENEARTGQPAADFLNQQSEEEQTEAYKAGSMRNLRTMSRTLQGVVDDAGSPLKGEALEASGDEAAQLAASNVSEALDFALSNRETEFKTAEDLLGFFDTIATTVNKGIVKQGKLEREHDVEGRYIPATEIPAARKEFADKLLGMLDTADPTEIGAFIKYELDHNIHPWTDGVGKATQIITDWAMARRGGELAVMPERGEYFENLEAVKPGGLAEYTKYFRSLVPGSEAPAAEVEAESSSPEEIAAAAAESPASPENDKLEPTQAQKEAGNYEKPQILWQGFKMRIENPAGSIRGKKSRGGVVWEQPITYDYGYIEGTKDRDGDAIDAYRGPNPNATHAYVVNQVRRNGDFDEHKVMLGFDSPAEALRAYREQYPEGHPAHQSEVVAMPIEKFRQWTKEGDTLGRLRVDENGDPIGPPMGKVQSTFAGEREIETQYQLREVDDVVTSHDLQGKPVPIYDEALQPRDRSREATQEQIAAIANPAKFKGGKITGARDIATGAPFVRADGRVISGNARVLILKKMYEDGHGDVIRDYYRENAAEFGLTPEQVDSLDRPALVLVSQQEFSDQEWAEIARIGNEPEVAQMSPAETARVDSGRLPDDIWQMFNPDQSGNVLAAGNDQFIRAFLQAMPQAARSQYMTADGRPTKQLADRMTAAVFQKAYQSDRILQLMAEEADPGIRNIINALIVAAPSFARARAAGDLGNMDVTVPLLDAIDLIRQSRATGTRVDELVRQEGLFSSVDPLVGDLAVFMDNNMRSAKRMGEAFSAMAGFIEKEVQSRRNASLFGQDRPINLRDVVRSANDLINERYGEGAGIPGDMFAPPQMQPGRQLFSRQPRDVTLQENYEVEGTGEQVAVEERASVLMRRMNKRMDNINRLMRCLG